MTGWVAIVIVTILAIPFAFFGMEQYLFQGGTSYTARIEAPPTWWRSAPDVWLVRKLVWNSEDISVEQFRNAFEQERQQRRIEQGDAYDARMFESAENRRIVLERLIDQTVLRMAADSRGIAVGDDRVRREIEQIPAFQVDGQFSPERYLMALQSQSNARSPRQFQELIRESLQQALLPVSVSGSAFVTDAQLDRLMTLLAETRDVSFAVLQPLEPDAGDVGEEDIQAWYQANVASYRSPERVSIEYIEMDASGLAIDGTPSEEELRARFASERARFAGEERRLVSHILIEVPAGAGAEAEADAEARAREVAGLAGAADADFAALAQEHSDDFGSSDVGGDIGWIEPGMMEPAFDQALSDMQPGEVSGPVRTGFGWHVLQLRELEAGERVAFEDVREQLIEEISGNARERAFSEMVGQVVDQAYRDPNSLEPAAEVGGVSVQRAGPFARGEGEGVIAHPALQRAAFTESLIEDGTVSDPVEVGPEHSVLIRVVDHEPERARPLEEVREDIIAAIRADRSTKRLLYRAESLVARMRDGDGATLQSLAEDEGLAVQDVPGLPRGVPAPHPDAVEAYFAAGVPAEGEAVPGMVELNDGSVVLFMIHQVKPGNPADASPQERMLMRQQLEMLAGEVSGQALLRNLRQSAKITVIESQLL